MHNGFSSCIKENVMTRAVAETFKHHPVKLAFGFAINMGGMLALAAQL